MHLAWQLITWVIIAAGVTAFELYCVATHNTWTISEIDWRVLGIKGFVVTHSSLRRMVLVGLWAVLTVHLFTGWI